MCWEMGVFPYGDVISDSPARSVGNSAQYVCRPRGPQIVPHGLIREHLCSSLGLLSCSDHKVCVMCFQMSWHMRTVCYRNISFEFYYLIAEL